MEDTTMVRKSASGYRYLDSAKLFEVAEHYGFPQMSVGAPDDSVRIYIAPTRSAWEHAVGILERYDLLELAYLNLDDVYGDLEDLPDRDIPESLHATRAHKMLRAWEKWFDRVRNLNDRDYRRVSVMLAYAESLDYPELVLTEYDYTIRGDMDGWLTAAKLFAGTPAIILATEKLIELKQSANEDPPCFPVLTTTKIHITGG